jgi:hypothetical protein
LIHSAAQSEISDIEYEQTILEIKDLAILLLNARSSESEKITIQKSIEFKLKSLSSNSKFQTDPFDSLYMMQRVVSPDNRFFILSGENRISPEVYTYYGGLFDLEKNVWIPFNYERLDFNTFEQRIDDDSNWYGGLYYKIIPFVHKRAKFYVLLGYAYKDYFRRIKFMDILSINNNSVVFGADVFEYKTSNPIKRMYLEYAAESPASLNYDENEQKIVFDNLIPFRGLYEGQGMILVPDGSYSAFELVKGKWKYLDKLSVTPQDSAPIERPILEKRKDYDIFGKPKGNN